MMGPRFERYLPSPLLTQYVKEYYLFEGPNTHLTNIIPAWNKSIMGLQFGGEISVDVNGEFDTTAPATLNDVITKPYQLEAAGDLIRFFVIEFTPIGIYLLFRENNEHFVDVSVNAFDIITGFAPGQLSKENFFLARLFT